MPKIKLKHAGGYDPRKGSKHPDNQDPTLPSRSAEVSAHATIGRILMAMLELLDMTDKKELERVLFALIPTSLVRSEVPALCDALRGAGAAKLAVTIEKMFDAGALR